MHIANRTLVTINSGKQAGTELGQAKLLIVEFNTGDNETLGVNENCWIRICGGSTEITIDFVGAWQRP